MAEHLDFERTKRELDDVRQELKVARALAQVQRKELEHVKRERDEARNAMQNRQDETEEAVGAEDIKDDENDFSELTREEAAVCKDLLCRFLSDVDFTFDADNSSLGAAWHDAILVEGELYELLVRCCLYCMLLLLPPLNPSDPSNSRPAFI